MDISKKLSVRMVSTSARMGIISKNGRYISMKWGSSVKKVATSVTIGEVSVRMVSTSVTTSEISTRIVATSARMAETTAEGIRHQQ